MEALSSPADILIGGGAAGVGKTFSLLLEPLRHIHVKNFGGVIFRRTSPQIRAEGGLWDASGKLYSLINNADSKETVLEWKFGDVSKIKFSHLEYEKNIYDWQGAEIPFIGFDELTHFSKKQFFYLLTRNRSTCGIRPYVRATCNPDPDSWVYDLVKWWINDEGYPIAERQGVLRYFIQDNNNYIWGDTKEEVLEKGAHVIKDITRNTDIDPREFVKSITFIGGSIYDNKELLSVDPGYLGNLNAQDEETKKQLLKGNWKVSLSDIDLYDYHKFQDIFTNTHVPPGEKFITTDIALKGSDKLIVFVWSGKMLIDFVVVDKSKGDVVINTIKGMAKKHGIPNCNIVFDNDGVGQFVDGFIDGAQEFNNGGKPKNDENYNHLKSQCFYKSAEGVYRAEYYIPDEVADMMYDNEMTLRQRLIHERKAVKRDKPDHDGKLRVIPKQQMKPFLNGQSPDVIETFMMREFFELLPDDYGPLW